MRYSVSHVGNRLGNDIQQFANSILLAKYYSGTVEQRLDHSIVDKFLISFGNDGELVSGKFYAWEPLAHAELGFAGGNELGISREYVYKNMREVCRDYLYPYLKIEHKEPLDDDTLVIHIRGGDVFDHVYDVPFNYVQNPWIYYEKLIEEFSKVIVVAEPEFSSNTTTINQSPILERLQHIYRVEIQSSSVAEDYATLLRAKNLATSGVGTFAISAALCSRNIKNLFVTNLCLTEHLNYNMMIDTDVIVHEMELPGYIPIYQCSWRNDEAQRKFMMEYKLTV